MSYVSGEALPLLNKRTRPTRRPALVIHGGAGAITRERSTPKERQEYKAALAKALLAGHEVLKHGGEALEAAVVAVNVMEDCPLFNAGKGAVFNVAGKHELEASVMLSKPPSDRPNIPTTRRGFGLTLLTRIKNPASLAKDLYVSPEKSPHAFLSGETAEDLCQDPSQFVDPCYFFTKRRWIQHRRGLGLPEESLPPCHESDNEPLPSSLDPPGNTVGAVALDERGCTCAVTSTGGLTNKQVGRIGDTPIMGSGFWAEEWTPKSTRFMRFVERIVPWFKRRTRAMGISGTGSGDFSGDSLEAASKYAIEELYKVGGEGGVVGLDGEGDVILLMNTPGMYRGTIGTDGIPKVAIFVDEELSTPGVEKARS